MSNRHLHCFSATMLAAASCLLPFASSATTVKALSFAVNEVNTSGDKTPIKTYMATNDVDFGAFEYTKAANYFINADFSQDGKNFRVAYYENAGNDIKYFVYSDKYSLVNTPLDDKSGNNMAGIFQDAYGDQYALISLRSTYKDDKPATLTPAKTFIEGIVAKYPDAKIIVTCNARLSGTYNGKTQQDILNTYLTENASGPQMTCLGRTEVDGTAIGGVYMYPNDVPSSYSVSLVPKSIGTKYDGTLATFEVPTKYKVIFNDYDGTGLQTNVVLAGASVTPPTPSRPGYNFVGWDHADSEFASVSASFTATAQYELAGNSHSVRFLDEDGETLVDEIAVADGLAVWPVFHFPLDADDCPEDDSSHDPEKHLPEREWFPKGYPVKKHTVPPVPFV